MLTYDPETGVFTWRVRPSNRVRVGDVAGHLGNMGYLQIRVDRVLYQSHRLAWLYVTGEWPPRLVDHRDLNRTNNRFDNLRLATDGENSINGPMRRHNETGFKGVGFHKQAGRYRARIRVGNKERHLGLFDTPEAAHDAYCRASAELHGDFGRVD